jgi:osmotically inducible protein OsmC
VPRIERTAVIKWEGNLARGAGLISAGSSGAFTDLPYSNATRIGKPEGKTSPEELLAAAHGGCFATSLAGELTGLGHPPEWLEVSCVIVMDEVTGNGHQIVGSEVTARASVPGAEGETFDRAVELADEGCPFSALLKRAGASVSIRAELVPA